MSNERYAPPKVTDLLCKTVVNTKFEHLSDWNVKCFKDRLLDTTGCLFGGAIVKDNQVLTDLLYRWGGAGEAPVFLHGFRTPLPNAVLLNCVTTRSNDYGSMAFKIFGEALPSHVGETLIPLNLTLADAYGVSGADFIAHNVAAEDMTARLLYSLRRRWPYDMLLVSSAAAALTSRYYGLDAAQTKAALSYAATNSTDPANAYHDYSHEFKYHNGESARCGIMSCELAKGGWSGLSDPYFGHWGLAVRNDNDELSPNYEKCIEGLGTEYFTEGCFKRFPCGIPNTGACIAAMKVRRQFEGCYKLADISRVDVDRSGNIRYNYYAAPFSSPTQINALFCRQFNVCCVLYHGDIRIEYIQSEALQSTPELLELVQKSTSGVCPLPSGQTDPFFRVRVTMKDGAVFEDAEPAIFNTSYPTQEEIIGKFRKQVQAYGKLPKAAEEKIIDLALHIETLSDMREYTSLLMG